MSHIEGKMLWEFSSLIDIVKLTNIDSKEFKEDDIYVLPSIYYTAFDEGDTEDCNKYIYFLKGNIMTDKLEVRG